MITFKRIEWCPGCGWQRLIVEGQPVTREEWTEVAAALHADEAAHPCCNRQCRGEWGTNCWHCHHPSYAPKRARLRRLMLLWARDDRRAVREGNRSAPRGTHYGLDLLAEKADRAERDRERLTSLPRWQRGEWAHIRQLVRGER